MKRIVWRLSVVASVFVMIGMLCPAVQAGKKVGLVVWSEDAHYRKVKDGLNGTFDVIVNMKMARAGHILMCRRPT